MDEKFKYHEIVNFFCCLFFFKLYLIIKIKKKIRDKLYSKRDNILKIL